MVRRENSYSARRVLLFIEQLARSPSVCVCEYSSESGEAAAPFVTRPCAQSEREYHPCSMQIFTLGRVNTSSAAGLAR
jgi:hypothetical protein